MDSGLIFYIYIIVLELLRKTKLIAARVHKISVSRKARRKGGADIPEGHRA